MIELDTQQPPATATTAEAAAAVRLQRKGGDVALHKGTEVEAAIGSGAAVQAAILTVEGSSQEHHLLLFDRHSCVNWFGDRPWGRDEAYRTQHPPRHGIEV